MSVGPQGPLARVAVLGDVHTEAETVRAVLTYVGETPGAAVDAVLCVGDIVDGEGDVDAALEAMREGGVISVAGNHERWFLAGEMRTLQHATTQTRDENREYLAAMPRVIRFETPAGGALLCHGVGEDDMSFLRPDTKGYDLQIADLRDLMLDSDVDYMLGGHTHQRMVRQFQGLVVVNAGTLRRDDSPGFIIVDFEAKRVRYFDIADFGATITEVETFALPDPLPLPPGYDEL